MSDLRFLADESCEFAVVHALRSKGYDVLAVSECMRRSDDRDLIEQSHRENRILLTEDKDFGWLVFASHAVSAGGDSHSLSQQCSLYTWAVGFAFGGTARRRSGKCLCCRSTWSGSI